MVTITRDDDTVAEVEYVTADKVELCDECGGKIPAGDQYWLKKECFEGVPLITKEHTNCELYGFNSPEETD